MLPAPSGEAPDKISTPAPEPVKDDHGALRHYTAIMTGVHEIAQHRANTILAGRRGRIRRLRGELAAASRQLQDDPRDRTAWGRRQRAVHKIDEEMQRWQAPSENENRQCEWAAGTEMGQARVRPPRTQPLPAEMSFTPKHAKEPQPRQPATAACQRYLESIFQRETPDGDDSAADIFCALVEQQAKRRRSQRNAKARPWTEVQQTLGAAITTAEVQRAAAKRADTAAGLDGIPFWLYAKSKGAAAALADALNLAWAHNELPACMRKSRVKMLYKDKGSKAEAGNYRPLTIGTTGYRLFSRVMATRLNKVIGGIVDVGQTGYVPGRVIQMNCLAIQYAQYWCQRENTPGVLFSIDFEKAFDSVNHKFLQRVLHAWGLGANFVRWAMLSTRGATVQADVNGELSQPVDVKSGVRQGCCLSPLLFILLMEAVLHAVRQDQTIRAVGHGTAGAGDKALAYADDASFLVLDHSDVDRVITWLNKFTCAAGLALSKPKSWMLRLAGHALKDDEIDVQGVQFLKREQQRQLLGLQIGHDTGASNTAAWRKRVQAARGALTAWNPNALSYRQRALVWNTFAASGVVYLAMTTPPGGHVEQELSKVARMFLWPQSRPKVSRETCANNKLGGISLRHVAVHFKAIRASWIPRLFAAAAGPWQAPFHDVLQAVIRHALGAEGNRQVLVSSGQLPGLLAAVNTRTLAAVHGNVMPYPWRCFRDWRTICPLTEGQLKQLTAVRVRCSRHGVMASWLSFHAEHRRAKRELSGVECWLCVDAPEDIPPLSSIPGPYGRQTRLQHTEDNEEQTEVAEICARDLYWHAIRGVTKPAAAVRGWLKVAAGEKDTPAWSAAACQLLQGDDWWRTMISKEVPWYVFNTSFEIAHRAVATKTWARQPDETCRRCGTGPETLQHVLLACPALAARLWPSILATLQQAGYQSSTVTDAVRAISLETDKTGGNRHCLHTTLAFFRHALVNTHLHHEGYVGEGQLQAVLRNTQAAVRRHVLRLYERAKARDDKESERQTNGDDTGPEREAAAARLNDKAEKEMQRQTGQRESKTNTEVKIKDTTRTDGANAHKTKFANTWMKQQNKPGMIQHNWERFQWIQWKQQARYPKKEKKKQKRQQKRLLENNNDDT